jgi:uncharacterized protein YndB with AHSA1/START domain
VGRVQGEVLEVDPPRRLVTTFVPMWADEADRVPTRVTWSITQEGNLCKLTLEHEGLDADTEFGLTMIAGWSEILSGLKTLLETGQPLAAG